MWIRNLLLLGVAWLALVAMAPAVFAAEAAAAGLDARVQDLKGDVIRLNRDLLVLEEELLFPAGTQVAVFVSMDVGKMFSLDSVQVKLDDKVVANYLYTPLEVEALHRGGVQRLFLGNLRTGAHELVAFGLTRSLVAAADQLAVVQQRPSGPHDIRQRHAKEAGRVADGRPER